MTRVFIDSNVWLRYFLKDNDQFESCQKLIQAVEYGQCKPYISSIVLLEVIYVLKSVYKLERIKISEIIGAITDMRNLTIIDKTNSWLAIKMMEKFNFKFADCLIATQVPKRAILATFDQELSKIAGRNCQTPAKILALLRD